MPIFKLINMAKCMQYLQNNGSPEEIIAISSDACYQIVLCACILMYYLLMLFICEKKMFKPKIMGGGVSSGTFL